MKLPRFDGLCHYMTQGTKPQPCLDIATYVILYPHPKDVPANAPRYTCSAHKERPVIRHHAGVAYSIMEKGRFLVQNGAGFQGREAVINVFRVGDDSVFYRYAGEDDVMLRLTRWQFIELLMSEGCVQFR